MIRESEMNPTSITKTAQSTVVVTVKVTAMRRGLSEERFQPSCGGDSECRSRSPDVVIHLGDRMS